MAKKKLNVGLVGYGFMGRTHSNAFRKVSNFFDLDYEPVMKAVQPLQWRSGEEDLLAASCICHANGCTR